MNGNDHKKSRSATPRGLPVWRGPGAMHCPRCKQNQAYSGGCLCVRNAHRHVKRATKGES